MNIICIIPARYSSKRFPGKAIAFINGSPMVKWVYYRALAAKIFTDIIVATDDQRIYDVVKSFQANVMMTSSELSSGTDRAACVAQTNYADIYVNLQVDEPLIPPQLLKDLCQPFHDNHVLVSTAVKKINSVDELNNPNLVKVIIDVNHDAIYFSRSIIPYCRDTDEKKNWPELYTYYKHIGIYAYRRDFLLKFSKSPQGYLERIEKLEQLRILENGYKIRTIITEYNSMGVDTPEELQAVSDYIKLNKIKVDDLNEKV
jgi:3-deoxy-manno-octulosonate cytidylyltransferase (CMP-KDO synthetase)